MQLEPLLPITPRTDPIDPRIDPIPPGMVTSAEETGIGMVRTGVPNQGWLVFIHRLVRLGHGHRFLRGVGIHRKRSDGDVTHAGVALMGASFDGGLLGFFFAFLG